MAYRLRCSLEVSFGLVSGKEEKLIKVKEETMVLVRLNALGKGDCWVDVNLHELPKVGEEVLVEREKVVATYPNGLVALWGRRVAITSEMAPVDRITSQIPQFAFRAA